MSARSFALACLVLTSACASSSQQEPALAAPSTESAAPVTEPAPPPLSDPCAVFEQNRSTLDPAEHERIYGCPPCPCACVNGEITCAPCIPCEAYGPPKPPPSPTP